MGEIMQTSLVVAIVLIVVLAVSLIVAFESGMIGKATKPICIGDSCGGGGGCVDLDKDTYFAFNASSCPEGNDCLDSNPSVHPGAVEVCGNTIDEDCNGKKADLCGIGVGIGAEKGVFEKGEDVNLK